MVAFHTGSGRSAAPDFLLDDTSGKTVSLKDYKGKVVLLDFRATSCGGCKCAVPDIAQGRLHGKELSTRSFPSP
jgi:cytochrome oxidase Cu insertion factor (SCO1/SenC/PrrC family)